MSTYRLYTRCEDFQSSEERFVTLGLTPRDFRSNPSLEYYVKHWFVDIDSLIDFLCSGSSEKIILITSDLTADIIQHDLRPLFPQIVRFVIIGKLSRQRENVEHFCDAQLLVEHISCVLRDRRRVYITFDRWPIERTSNSLNRNTGKFLWYSYFYSVLSRLRNTAEARTEMLESIQAFHTKQIDVVKKSCEDFQQFYNSMDVIKWYTKDSFFYLLLNRTLRSENINHIFAMRYVISDLENSLPQICSQSEPIDIVYRGQKMYSYEIQEIATNIKGLIGLTTFWSASRSKKTAQAFNVSGPSEGTNAVENIIFTIRMASNLRRYSCFDISQMSAGGREFEVLFSFRSIFRVEQATKNENSHCWDIDLTLIDDNDEQFTSLMDAWYSAKDSIIGHRSFYTPIIDESKENFFRHLTLDNGPFLSFQLLLDMILRLDQTEFARNELLQVCREYYSNDPTELRKINEFERTYNPKEAIQWYTTDCFLYRLINRSLRIESIDFIFKLRYFIHDLHNQLAQMQAEFVRTLPINQSILRLYRGLRMNLHELQEIQKNQGKFVSTNTFLSTTGDYEAALFFAGDGHVDEKSVSVIYEIDVDTTIKHSIPFARIDYQSKFKDEDEVLFSMAAVFRLGNVQQLKDHLWTVHLTLTRAEDEQWNVLTGHLHSR